MILLGPRPFLLAGASVALVHSRQYFMHSIPVGAPWRLKWIFFNWLRNVSEVEGGQLQNTPDLLYRLYDADGRCFHVAPVLIPQVTTPGGGPNVTATNSINIEYPGGSAIKMEIEGKVAGERPDSISYTLYGIRGWEKK